MITSEDSLKEALKVLEDILGYVQRNANRADVAWRDARDDFRKKRHDPKFTQLEVDRARERELRLADRLHEANTVYGAIQDRIYLFKRDHNLLPPA